jgi:hypothetical protein
LKFITPMLAAAAAAIAIGAAPIAAADTTAQPAAGPTVEMVGHGGGGWHGGGGDWHGGGGDWHGGGWRGGWNPWVHPFGLPW